MARFLERESSGEFSGRRRKFNLRPVHPRPVYGSKKLSYLFSNATSRNSEFYHKSYNRSGLIKRVSNPNAYYINRASKNHRGDYRWPFKSPEVINLQSSYVLSQQRIILPGQKVNTSPWPSKNIRFQFRILNKVFELFFSFYNKVFCITDRGRRSFHVWFDYDSLNWVLESLPRLVSGSTWACVKVDVKRTLEIAIDSNHRGDYIRILETRTEGNRFIHIPFGVHNDGPNLFSKALLSFVERVRCLNKDKGLEVLKEAVGASAALGEAVGVSTALDLEVSGLGENVAGPVPTLASKDTIFLEHHLQDLKICSNIHNNGLVNHDKRVQPLEGQFLEPGNTSDQSFCSVALVLHKQKENSILEESFSSYNSQFPQLPKVCLSPFATEFIPLNPNSFAALFNDLENGSPNKEDGVHKIDDGNTVLRNNALEDIREEREGPILYTHSEGEDKAFNDNILKPLQIDYSRMFKTPFDLGREFKGRNTYSPSQIVTRSKAKILEEGRKKFPLVWEDRSDGSEINFTEDIRNFFKECCPNKPELATKKHKQALNQKPKEKVKKET